MGTFYLRHTGPLHRISSSFCFWSSVRVPGPTCRCVMQMSAVWGTSRVLTSKHSLLQNTVLVLEIKQSWCRLSSGPKTWLCLKVTPGILNRQSQPLISLATEESLAQAGNHESACSIGQGTENPGRWGGKYGFPLQISLVFVPDFSF